MQSFWQMREYPAFPSISTNLSVDVLVIGGGITGVSVAYHLKGSSRFRVGDSELGDSVSPCLTYKSRLST
jgi:hypothetical protein